jgi:hypothetical protein
MTFGAMAAWQAWLLLAAAGGCAAALFLLKLRPPRVIVPSLLLWRRVLDEAREITLWERIRRAVSLVATIAIALALALAVARPSRVAGTTAASEDRRLVVLDSSWSMMARTASGERRWDRALGEARRLIASGGEVAIATTADGLVEGPSSDLTLVETALDRLSPAGGESTIFPRIGGADAVHFITDGALTRPLDPAVVVHSVFESAPNVAITALDVRPPVSGSDAGNAYLEIANFAPAAQKVRIMLMRGTASVFDQRVDLAAGDALRQVIPLARGADPMLRAHVEAPANALDADDDAYAWIAGARPLSILLVSQHPEWLRALFDHDPGVRATVVDPSSYSPAAAEVDVIVFDRWAPAEAPARPALCIGPPSDTPWLSGGASDTADRVPDERRPRWESPGFHAVVRGVDPFTLTIERARRYRSPELVPVAQSTRGTPLVSISESRERRAVVVAFGPGESNLTSAPGFPVLVGNAIEWLARPVVGPARRPGIVTFDNAIARVTGPRGVDVALVRLDRSAIADLRVPGVYMAESGGSHSPIVVNVGDPQVSNLQKTHSSATRDARVVKGGMSGRPWWLYCVVVAFALVFAEWWTWQRRITV